MKKITAAIAAIMMLSAIPVTAAYGADKETTPVQTEKKADAVSARYSVRLRHYSFMSRDCSTLTLP